MKNRLIKELLCQKSPFIIKLLKWPYVLLCPLVSPPMDVLVLRLQRPPFGPPPPLEVYSRHGANRGGTPISTGSVKCCVMVKTWTLCSQPHSAPLLHFPASLSAKRGSMCSSRDSRPPLFHCRNIMCASLGLL